MKQFNRIYLLYVDGIYYSQSTNYQAIYTKKRKLQKEFKNSLIRIKVK